MSQNNISFDGSMTGASMLDERLTPLLNNLYSSNSGSTRPSYLQAGGTWFDSPNGKLMLFNGISEIPLSTLITATETEAVTGSDDTKAMTPSGTTKVVGIGKYYVTRTYAEDDVVLNVDDGEIKLYQSLTDNNVGNDLTDATKWKIVKLGGGGEIGDVGLAPFGIDETLNLRRYLNGQVISQSQFASFTNKIKAIAALFPSLATTEVNWQSEKSLSKLGQCGRFVIDDDAGTIRLPCAVNIQSLTDLQYLGTIKNESLPNISGSVISSTATQGILMSPSGAFFNKTGTIKGTFDAGVAGANFIDTLGFNASRSSPTYQDNAPVQQEAIQYPYYIQVATGVEETLPAIREYKVNNSDFFGKSMYSETNPYNASWLVSNGQYNAKTVYPDYYDWLLEQMNAGVSGFVSSTATYTDYDFVINTADQTFRLPLLDGSEGLPGDRYDSLTLLASGSTYTAPANGWFVLRKFSGTSPESMDMVSDGGISSSTFVNGYSILNCMSVLTKRNEEVTINYYTTGATDLFRFIYAKGNGSLHYYVGDTVQDASLINAGAVLNDVANLKARRYVTETFINGTSWYRIWSDGWVEQGGVLTNRTENVTTFNLLIPYNNTNFTGTAGVCTAAAMNNGYNSCVYGINSIAPVSGSQACTRTVGWSDTSWAAWGYRS